MSEDKKMWRTESLYIAENVRVMKVGEPRKLSDDKTLCSFSFVDQPGNERYQDMWVQVTGANGLAERIFNMQVGDRVCVRGKLVMRPYEKDGETRMSFEIPFPERVVFLTSQSTAAESEETEEEVEEEEAVEEPAPTPTIKRKPGRPRKNTDKLPF